MPTVLHSVRRHGALVAALCCLVGAAAADPLYSARQLVSPDGGTLDAVALSARGEVVGEVIADAGIPMVQAFAMTRHHYTAWAVLGRPRSGALAVNAAGDIAGELVDPQTRPHLVAFARAVDGGALELFAGMDIAQSAAYGINAARTVVGSYEPPAGGAVPYAWSDGTLTTLPTLGGTQGTAMAINDAALIVGWANDAGEHPHAVSWSNGVATNLGELALPGASSAAAVSSHGWVVGSSSAANGQLHAALWHDGQAIDLGTLGGGSYSQATGVNADGTVVGYTANSSNVGVAFLWRDGRMTDLNALVDLPAGWILSVAKAINDAGQILARAVDRHEQVVDVLLTPKTR